MWWSSYTTPVGVALHAATDLPISRTLRIRGTRQNARSDRAHRDRSSAATQDARGQVEPARGTGDLARLDRWAERCIFGSVHASCPGSALHAGRRVVMSVGAAGGTLRAASPARLRPTSSSAFRVPGGSMGRRRQWGSVRRLASGRYQARLPDGSPAPDTFPTTHTKSAMGWTSATDVARHQSGTRTYDLHAIGLRQPPPPGRVTAVRVPVVPLEARLEVEQYERRDVSGEGIIVYEDSAPGRHGSVARGRTVSQQRWCLGGGTPSRTPRSLHQGRERARSPW
jgi:hypothetical protein